MARFSIGTLLVGATVVAAAVSLPLIEGRRNSTKNATVPEQVRPVARGLGALKTASARVQGRQEGDSVAVARGTPVRFGLREMPMPLDVLWERVASADGPELLRLLQEEGERVRFVSERKAVQFVSCDGAIVGHMPLRSEQLLTLSQEGR
jgi:hypothetical protein